MTQSCNLLTADKVLMLLVRRIFHNLFLHPLRKFPGPVSHAASRLPIVAQLWRGKLIYHLEGLHARYGPVVRTAPDELSFLDTVAWKDIYGRRVGLTSGLPEIPKWQRFYRVHATKGQTTIMNADCELHARLRRHLAPGFSERSMRAQEGIIGSHVDLLLQRLGERRGTIINMTKWYIWTTADIISDLALGSSFGCLKRQDWHPWVKQFAGSSKEFTYISGLRMLGFDWLVGVIMSVGVPARKKILALTAEALKKRLERGVVREDLIEGMLKNSESEV